MLISRELPESLEFWELHISATKAQLSLHLNQSALVLRNTKARDPYPQARQA